MRSRLWTTIRICLAAWLAIGLALFGSLVAGAPGGVLGAFLGGLVVGRTRHARAWIVGLAWACFLGVSWAVSLLTLPRLDELSSFAATGWLLLPGALVGSLAAGAIEGAARQRGWRRQMLGLALGSTGAIVLFRSGFAVEGVALAGLLYALLAPQGATIAE